MTDVPTAIADLIHHGDLHADEIDRINESLFERAKEEYDRTKQWASELRKASREHAEVLRKNLLGLAVTSGNSKAALDAVENELTQFAGGGFRQ